MNWHNRKHVTNLIMGVLVALLAAGTYFLYTYYRAEHLADYKMQDTYANPKRTDSVAIPDMRTLVRREIDSIKKASAEGLVPSSGIQINPAARQSDSINPPQALHRTDSAVSQEAKDNKTGSVLHAPSAVFSHHYNIAIGKSVPVNISWQDANGKMITCRLVTVKVNDIADKKAKLTIEDPFNVLLFSQTGYGANDKIVIEDSRHNITISLLQVTDNSVSINMVSHLDESIVSKLQVVK